ncbi:uncharacterized protein LOC121643299 isoform X2 [Melanotaenia boesemani]|uniref:uncharacterized protein LOC121643299 isoform X2 n=1 Tax=Melanotaenia boesemani TaxID=1250792 RepID=UPI001C05D98F|nr:uncharacterized protein LOC121643299 isoform X2 [Melanotaenia boesemani]
MLIIVYLSLMLIDGRCADPILETKTNHVGDSVKLTCSRRSAGDIFWMRAVWGNSFEVLNTTYTKRDVIVQREPGILDLKIKKAKLSDAGVYICMRKYDGKDTVLNLTYLRIEEPTATPVPTSGPVCPEDSVTLQCSELSDAKNKSCPVDYRVLCFHTGSNQSQAFNNTEVNGHIYENSTEGGAFKQCFYNNFKCFSSSDSSVFNCTAAKCEKEKNTNKSKLDTEVNMWKSRKDDAVIHLLCAALAISLIVIAVLIYFIQKLVKRLNGSCDASTVVQTEEPDDHNSPQANEDSVVYSTADFIRRKSSKTGRMGVKHAEEETVYSDIRVLGV